MKFLILMSIISVLFISELSAPQGQEKIVMAIAYAETGHLPEPKRHKAVSVSGAIGKMQVMPITGKHMKCGNLFNPDENLRCAKKYLRWLRRNYCHSDLFCLVMSYRHGPSGFIKKMKTNKIDKKYWWRFRFGA